MIWSKTVLVWSRLEIFVDSGQNQTRTFAAGQRSEIGRYKVHTEVSLGIGRINEDLHIAGICQVVTERLKRALMYSMALGPRCVKWKMLSLSGPNA